MKILQNFKVPTGNILVVEGEKGKLECLSLGDYGKDINLNQNKSVPDGLPLLPLEEKWVATISSQYSCAMKCSFCDCSKIQFGGNATLADLKNQLRLIKSLHPHINGTQRFNVHFARMGEPTFNDNVLKCALWLKECCLFDFFHVHPVVSTMLPVKNKNLGRFLSDWMFIKNHLYEGEAGLQLSINSTDDGERFAIFGGNACTFAEIREYVLPFLSKPVGRKITLNFIVADYEVDPNVLLKYFDPDWFICKITPMHKTKTALENGQKTKGDYTTPEPYLDLEYKLKKAGYEVLVFIASRDEDEGRITCGNAILSGSLPHKYNLV